MLMRARAALIAAFLLQTAVAGPLQARSLALAGRAGILPGAGTPGLSLGQVGFSPLKGPSAALGSAAPAPVSVLPALRTPGLGPVSVLPALETPALQAPVPIPISVRARKTLSRGAAASIVFDGTRSRPAFAAVDGAGGALSRAGRTSPRAAERPAAELAIELDALYGELKSIHAEELARGPDFKKDELDARKRAFRTRLAAFDAELNGTVAESFADARVRLKGLHSRKKALTSALINARAADDHEAHASLSRQALDLDRDLVGTQVRVAERLLSGASPLRAKAARRNAALWTLAGAYNSAAELKAGTRLRDTLARRTLKRREYETFDGLGNPVQVFQLEGFDLEVRRARAGEKLSVTIRQRRWHKGPPAEAVWHDVVYEDLETALRSQARTLASNLDESGMILGRLADLEYWADIIGAAQRAGAGETGPGRSLGARDKKRLGASLSEIVRWAERGMVPQKREAARRLEDALAAVETGALEAARTGIASGAAALRRRLEAIDAISNRVRRRVAAIYADFRAKR